MYGFLPVSEMTYTVSSGTLNPSIPYHTMVSYYCPIATLSVNRTVLERFDFKNVVTLKTGLRVCEGH